MNNSVLLKGWSYFKLALLVFLSIGIELVYAFFLEPSIYGKEMENWNTNQAITHWIITCISWSIALYLILRYAKNKLNFSIYSNDKNIEIWRWGLIVVCILISTRLSYISWNGFKPLKEFMNLGLLKFIFQYLYYFIETCMFMGIIVFGQLAFEKWFKNPNIPYGGIICALTWGVGHFATKGSVIVGLSSMLLGFMFGSLYLLLKRNTVKAILVLFLMFIL